MVFFEIRWKVIIGIFTCFTSKSNDIYWVPKSVKISKTSLILEQRDKTLSENNSNRVRLG